MGLLKKRLQRERAAAMKVVTKAVPVGETPTGLTAGLSDRIRAHADRLKTEREAREAREKERSAATDEE